MYNPFETADGSYLVLMNDEGQYSIWPAFLDIPAGWVGVTGVGSRQTCCDYISSRWTDLRPNYLKSGYPQRRGK
jgi:MbtH protein